MELKKLIKEKTEKKKEVEYHGIRERKMFILKIQ